MVGVTSRGLDVLLLRVNPHLRQPQPDFGMNPLLVVRVYLSISGMKVVW